MKLKTATISKQLHSSCSSYSSNDEFVYVDTYSNKIDFELINGSIQSVNFPFLNGETIEHITENQILVDIALKSDETYYHNAPRGFHGCSKEQMKALLNRYLEKGWQSERPPFLDEYYARTSRLEKERRLIEGFVIPAWSKDLRPEVYQGGLSDKLFNHPEIRKYVEGGHVCGYMGATERTFEIDRVVEKLTTKYGYKIHAVAVFLCSTSGRHFADQLDSPDAVVKHFDAYWPKDKEWFAPAVKAAKELASK